MSRSYKKHPVTKTHNEFTQQAKRKANKRDRRKKGVSDGCNHKRVYPQWEVCERRSYCSEKDWIDGGHGDTISWRKNYLRK